VRQLVVVSNRGPYRLQGKGARRKLVKAAGGLVTALLPVLRERGGVWVSAQETDHPLVEEALPEEVFDVHGVAVPKREAFYGPFSNGVLWPLLHSMQPTIPLADAPYDAYEAANRAFADACVDAGGPDDLYWIHDYHLQRVPGLLRERRPDARIGWFCHVPWPSPDFFSMLPWREAMLDGLLGADVLGFHTRAYADRFLACVAQLTPHTVEGDTVQIGPRTVRIIVAPIGIAWGDLQRLATSSEVSKAAQRIRERTDGRRLILGVDRLDYTKGVPNRLRAWARLLKRRPRLREGAIFVQLMVPSREAVLAYRDLKAEVDRLVGEINGDYSLTGRVPVHYFYRSLPPDQLYGHYLASEVAFITPLRDGMNLVAHEYCAARVDEGGALVLSEFAGAAQFLDGAMLVNPYDVAGTADVLEATLRMPAAQRRTRMKMLRERVKALDVHAWARGFLEALEA
jgi:trehalose 6-phosphate synthase/phosphatase